MKKVQPFKGIFYNQDKLNSYAQVVSPPYDVITPEMQQTLFERHDFNFCRLDLPQEVGEGRYSLAEKLYKEWTDQEMLQADNAPAIYIHHHTFKLDDGKEFTRKGFFAARRIEDFSEGGIKPHEKTLEGPKQDRLRMTMATKVNLSPIFSIYSDPQKEIQDRFDRLVQATAWLDFMSQEGERHQIWKLTDQESLDYIDQFLSDKPLFIADGHHRYETALNYRNQLIQEKGELAVNSAANFVMMYFSNMNDEGMVVLPIHRALHNMSQMQTNTFLEKLSPFFEIKKQNKEEGFDPVKELAAVSEDHHSYLLLCKEDPQTYYRLTLERQKWLDSSYAKELPASLAGLDVSVLHHYIFGHILGMSEESQAKQENIIYWKSTERAVAETLKGNCDYTFLLNPTRIEDMQEVALSGQKMPQKSTFFYPKIISGLLLHDVDDQKEDGV